MVDVHCHILPQVDDGAKSWEVTLEMCRMAAADGITHIVATPHANSQYVYDREAHENLLQELRDRTAGQLSFSLGCDFHFSYVNIEDALAHPERYAISGTKYMLIELSDYSIPPNMLNAMSQLNAAGLKLILTHPERNSLIQRRPELVLRWAEAGCIVQVTASSITGFWGRVAKKVSRWLIKHDAVHVIATDAHDTKHRPPLLADAREQVIDFANEDLGKALFEDNPRAIVAGEPLPFFPKPIP